MTPPFSIKVKLKTRWANTGSWEPLVFFNFKIYYIRILPICQSCNFNCSCPWHEAKQTKGHAHFFRSEKKPKILMWHVWRVKSNKLLHVNWWNQKKTRGSQEPVFAHLVFNLTFIENGGVINNFGVLFSHKMPNRYISDERKISQKNLKYIC
jgi:hypothetical protein